MKNIILTSLLLITFLCNVQAQQGKGFGFKGGLNYNSNGDYFQSISSNAENPNGSVGFHFGLFGKFGGKINSKFHEDTPAFTKDGKTVYFTRNNYLDDRGFDASKVTLLKIYKATVDKEGQWNNITALPFNSDSYQTAHPALSPDEKTLYFV